MKLELQTAAPATVETELLVVFAADQNTGKDKDAKPELTLLGAAEDLKRAASRILDSGEFKAKANETLLLHAPRGVKAARLLLVGLGKGTATVHELRRAAGTAVRFAKPRGIRWLAFVAPANFDPAQATRAIVEGAVVADFDSDTYRTDRKDLSIASVALVAAEADRRAAETGMREGRIVAEAQNFARSLINEPGNRMTPTILGQKAAEMCREFGVKCDVYGTDKLRELKMGAFLSVAQGSDEPPALIVMTYEPADGPAEPVLGLVGEGNHVR